MTTLEFIYSMTRALVWPALIVALLIYYRSSLTKIATVLLRMKLKVDVVNEGRGPEANTHSPAILNESSFYKLYSNGLIVQELKLHIASGIDELLVVFPTAFSNELLSVQVMGHDMAWPVRATLGDCDLRIAPSNHEREIQLKISGI